MATITKTIQHFNFYAITFYMNICYMPASCILNKTHEFLAFAVAVLHAGNAWANWANFVDASIQMEWWHSENEGSLQTFEGTIYEFVQLQRTGLLSAQKKGQFSLLKWKRILKGYHNSKLVRFWLRLVQKVSEAYHKNEQEPHRNVWATTSYQHAQIYDL